MKPGSTSESVLFDEVSEFALSGHHTALEYHRNLLDDFHRMDCYERAIRRLVRPGDVVLDAGCGTGVLAMLAARRGARVHAVESTVFADLAESLVAANGLEDRVSIHRADLRSLTPVEPVDLVLSDFMGRLVVDDWMIPAVRAACTWLKPDGRFCPARVGLVLAPVGDIYLRAVDRFTEDLLGLRLDPAMEYALNYCYHASLGAEALMAEAIRTRVFAPPFEPGTVELECRFDLNRTGRLQAVAGWFVAELADGVVLSTEPGIETHWGQYLFPLPPTQIVEESSLEFSLRLETEESERGTELLWRWCGSVRQPRSGEAGELFELESLQRLGAR